jgi:hypothetical protein
MGTGETHMIRNHSLLFVVWLLSSVGLSLHLASFDPINIHLPWPGFVGSIFAGFWLFSSIWLFFGLSPEKLIRAMKEKR